MDGHRCKQCRLFWSSQATGIRFIPTYGRAPRRSDPVEDRFVVINQICPDCISKAPALAVDLLDDPRYDLVPRMSRSGSAQAK